MSKIYFDHSATTPMDREVFEAMKPYFYQNFGNASSVHNFGQEAAKAVDQSRQKIAKFLNCLPEEIIFTSGATEADNLALQGVIKAVKEKVGKSKKLHLITSQIEHPAILEPAKKLGEQGIEVTYLPVTKKGLVKVEDVKKALKENTVLVSIMYVNNEIGTIQPISEIGKLISNINRTRKGNKIYFHTDAVQAANFCDLDVKQLGIDLLSLSGHKIYGPKGIGLLFVKKETPIKPIEYGGHHEYGIRPGTLNVPAIVGLGKAIELLSQKSPVSPKARRGEKIKSQNKKIKELRDYLIDQILQKIPETQVNGDLEKRIESNANFSFRNAEGESILLMLDMEGIATSTGSACSSGSLEPSHVLTAMGIPDDLAHGSLRITLGRDNTKAEIDKLIEVLPKIISRLRGMSPLK